jgi:hypothetical protein
MGIRHCHREVNVVLCCNFPVLDAQFAANFGLFVHVNQSPAIIGALRR